MSGAPIVTLDAWDAFPPPARAALMPGLQRYFDQRIEPGHFLCAVLENDLAETCRRADWINAPILREIVAWLDRYAPSTSWGSRAAVEAWLAREDGP